jgi:predicted  nucleic acid-binding Zn-ribbon protein
LKPIKHELHVKITEANSIRSELDSLKEQRKTTEGQSKVQKTAEEIKAEYDIKFKAFEERRDKLEDRIDDYVDKFVRENDDYEDQQDLLKYIKWVEDQVAWLKKKKE